MPKFLYFGPGERVYPEIMTAEGSLTAQPGDVRDLDENPGDGYWADVTPAPATATAAPKAPAVPTAPKAPTATVKES